ncbi:Zinc finger protein ZAT5 [Acorus gramineus]|uniref:Zinc finger protein ZAT5 n=1 Tax=Acorus gramineus TaxID=55184 RepID=A0AAV9BCR2_ACOGR|nr:Zinc finger protein ZAT5 [Acorus gramineus]
MRWHSDEHPLLGFIGGGEGAPQSRKRKRGSRKPRQDFPCHPSSPSDEKLRTEEAAECLLLLSGGHWVEDHHPSADSEAEEKKKRLYTCTTCGRTFSSFQALGGHRTYHNKAEKDRPMEEPNPSTVMPSKVHGCNVCEKVFPSGQALGGHMRSHFNAHAQSKREKEPYQAVPITGLFDLNLPAVPEF